MAMDAPAGGALHLDGERTRPALRERVLARVVAGVVHDLRTPLGTMAMKLQLLRDSIAGEAGVPDVLAAHLRVLDAQIERMTEMVRRVANTIEPPATLGWVDAGALLADVAGTLGHEARLRSVEVAVAPRSVAARTWADPSRVGLLLLCVVERAIATAAKGGRLLARADSREGAAVIELDRPAAPPEPSAEQDWDALAAAAGELGGRLERGPAGQGLERITLKVPGTGRP
jgi:hypothetical protein